MLEIVESMPLSFRLGLTFFTQEMAYLLASNSVHMALVTVLLVNLSSDWLFDDGDLPSFNLSELYSFFGIAYFVFSGWRDFIVQPIIVGLKQTSLEDLILYR